MKSIYIMQIKWFKSKPKWFQYITFGALICPVSIAIVYLLAFLTTPIGLRDFFEQII